MNQTQHTMELVKPPSRYTTYITYTYSSNYKGDLEPLPYLVTKKDHLQQASLRHVNP